MSKTRAQVLEVLKDWMEREMAAKPRGFAGNSIIDVSLDCEECGGGSIRMDVGALADRIVAAIEDGRIVVPAKVPA